MIVDYAISPEHLPSDRQVWLMSRNMEKDGLEVNLSIMRGLEKGEIRYEKGVLKKLCRHCFDYHEPSDFVKNTRYVLGVHYICKKCTNLRRRIKKYGTVSFVTEVGIESDPIHFEANLKESTKEILKRSF
jgi:hypothetical protein